jgi:hypothetical protein
MPRECGAVGDALCIAVQFLLMLLPPCADALSDVSWLGDGEDPRRSCHTRRIANGRIRMA